MSEEKKQQGLNIELSEEIESNDRVEVADNSEQSNSEAEFFAIVSDSLKNNFQ